MKKRLRELFHVIKGFKSINKYSEYKNQKKIFHVSTPTHGNMGDQAIVYATNKYLKDNFKEYKIIEVYRKDIYKYSKAIKKSINNDDFIVLIGGGNMGNLWIEEEIDRRFVIKTFAKSKIISMPQTLSFTNDESGQEEFLKTKKVYNSHKNLTILAREKRSYNLMKDAFINNNILLSPDMVLYLNDMFDVNFNNRKGIMTCIRNDKESILGNKKEEFIDKLKKEYNDIFIYDTVINREVLKENREKELMDMFNKFRQSKIVITDRLHGMVFAAITKTPCIVTKSLDHKVTGTYEWIKDLNYIKLVDELTYDKVKPLIIELMNLSDYTKIDLNKDYFNNLKSKIIYK